MIEILSVGGDDTPLPTVILLHLPIKYNRISKIIGALNFSLFTADSNNRIENHERERLI